jgi:hypothetical protein
MIFGRTTKSSSTMKSHWPLLLLVLLSGGCGQARLAPVTGKVTLDDAPLANVHVTIQPQAAGGQDAGSGSYAVTAADGTYTLRTIEGDRPGAVIGKHRVEIDAPTDTTSDADRRATVAGPYSDPLQSPERIEPGRPAGRAERREFPAAVALELL